MATQEQIQSVIDLNESGDRNLTGWNQTKGQYKHPSNYPAELRHAKNKKIEQTPVSSGIIYKLINNFPTPTLSLLKNGIEVGTIPHDGSTVILDGYTMNFHIVTASGNGYFEALTADLDETPFLNTQWDISEFLISDAIHSDLFGLCNSDYSTYVAWLEYDANNVFKLFDDYGSGFIYDQVNFLVTGPNFQ